MEIPIDRYLEVQPQGRSHERGRSQRRAVSTIPSSPIPTQHADRWTLTTCYCANGGCGPNTLDRRPRPAECPVHLSDAMAVRRWKGRRVGAVTIWLPSLVAQLVGAARGHGLHKLITTRGSVCGKLPCVVARQSGEVLRAGDLEVHPTEFLAYAAGHVIMLTRTEQQLLATMMRNDGRIMSRYELYTLVWGRKMRPGDRTVDVFVRKLRVRLEEALPGWKFIHTHFGSGYRFAAERIVGQNGSFTTS